MTERGRGSIARDVGMLGIGPSSLHWQDGRLRIDLDEIGAPLARRITGTIRVTPTILPKLSFNLDASGRHVWQPIAPRAHIEVDLERPQLRWTGEGYLDSNFGTEPLEEGFANWSWARAHLMGSSVVLYDAHRRDGADMCLALRFTPDGLVQTLIPPPPAHLKATAWGLARPARLDDGKALRRIQTLEDTPFYSRSRINGQLYGEHADIFHESLDLDRFRLPLVRAMLPFRMPRSIF